MSLVIYVYGKHAGDGGKYLTYLPAKWKIEPGRAVGNNGVDLGSVTYGFITTWSTGIQLIPPSPGKAYEDVAIRYMNAGYGTNLSQWPPQNQDTTTAVNPASGGSTGCNHSATMSEKGDLPIPHKMTLYFPLKIVSPDGFEINLLLGQSTDTQGFLHTLEDVAKAAKEIGKACAYVEEENDLGVARQMTKLETTLKTLFTVTYIWHVTIIGTTESPAFVIPEVTIDKKVTTHPQLWCFGPDKVGERHVASIEYKWQEGGDGYNFLLNVSEKPPYDYGKS